MSVALVRIPKTGNDPESCSEMLQGSLDDPWIAAKDNQTNKDANEAN